MEYHEFLRQSAEEHNTIACMGADPALEKIELVIKNGSVEDKIFNFYSAIIDACVSESVFPAAIKPNYAFYGQYGFEGLRALKRVCEKVRETKLPLILDAKRADIGNTSASYAIEAFNFWNVDSVTVAPYMGSDSVLPFVKHCAESGRGIYILNRTSNPGAVDLQNLMVGEKPLFIRTAEKIIEWGAEGKGNVGAVVGAPSIAEFGQLAAFFAQKKVPMLIPGVGKQGGSAEEVMKMLRQSGSDIALQRINSSREINYAFEKEQTEDFAGAAVKALKSLNSEIGFSRSP